MNLESTIVGESRELSAAAQRRMRSAWGEPMFYADWLRAVFIHFEVDASALQRAVPLELDLYEGRAYVSLVAFTMRGMRPCLGGRLGALLFKPIATHEFLNVRAYVKHNGEAGIHFLAEWLANPLSVKLGPPLFGLPYRRGRFDYQHRHEDGSLAGLVSEPDGSARLEYHAEIDTETSFRPCDADSRDEYLMERYTAFTKCFSWRRYFRIWHPPWPQVRVEIEVPEMSLLTNVWPWFADATMIGANYSPGVNDVWMGRPHGAVI
jgi:uncharacterized protein YqjF (DUF2071 family)